MNFRNKIISAFLFVVFYFLFPGSALPQPYAEKGELTIRNYHQKEFKGSAQNFCIVQDKRGVMYFANNGGALEYDGVSWQLIRMPNNSIVKAVAIDENGKIYVGASNELGYLAPDSSGLLTYYSLAHHITEINRDFGTIWKVFPTNKGIYFQANSALFLWNGTTMKSWKPETIFTEAFVANHKLYLYMLKKGLYIMNGEDVVPVIDGDEFSDKPVADMISLDNEKILVLTKNHGIFTLASGGVISAYPANYRDGNSRNEKKIIPVFGKETDDFLKGKTLQNAIRINNDLFSFGTEGDGIFIVHRDGYIVQTINKEAGLQDNIIRFQYVDAHGNLWIALDNGIAKIEINSPINSFTDKSGIIGTIEAVSRHQSDLYVGTRLGVFYYKNDSGKLNTKRSQFVPLQGAGMECWDFLSFKKANTSILLAGLNDGVFEIKPNKEVSLVVKCATWTLCQSTLDSSRVYIGLADGIMSIYYDNGHWINEGKIKGIDEEIFKIAEDEKGNLWLGTLKQGVLKLNFYMSDISSVMAKGRIQRDVKVFRYNEKDGLPDGDIIVIKEKNEPPLFGTDKGLYRFDEKEEKFYPDSVLMEKTTPLKKGIHRLNKDRKGNLWMVNYAGSEFEAGFAKFLNNGDIIWNSTPFVEISKGVIHAIYHDEHGISWLGGADGLYRYNSNIEKDYTKPYHTLIRKVSIDDDSAIFKGTNFDAAGLATFRQSDIFKSVLSYGSNSIIFEFAAQSYENESATLYSRYLEGFDKSWSEWKNESKAVYTNLHEGQYIFRVKAKNLYHNISDEATYEFTILPPWYRTLWAYIMYAILFFGIIYTGIKMNIRRLEKKNQELEEIITERTTEIVKQKEVIEHKNRDIMDSINYAQGIQQAILPPDEKFKKYLPDSFILFMPRDVVSGDFYWMEVVEEKVTGNQSSVIGKIGNEQTPITEYPPEDGFVHLANQSPITTLFAVCDCTGHGVPGGFVSMVGQNALRRAVNELGLIKPEQILDSVSLIVEEAFSKGKRKDGMDVVLCSLKKSGKSTAILEYSAANNPLYLVRKKEKGLLHKTISGTKISSVDINKVENITQEKPIEPDAENDTYFLFHLDPDKQPVGAYDYRKPFSNHLFLLKPGDTIYLSSDGFRDQFGGPKGKKYMAKNFKQLLVSIQDKTMEEQKNLLHKNITDWMGDVEQNDDICIIGVRV